MRILNIMQCTNLGGMEQASLRLMRGLQGKGHSVQVISLNPIGALAPHLTEAGIEAEGLAYCGKGGWKTALLLRRRLSRIKADALLMTGHHLLAMMVAIGKFCEGRRVLAIHHYHTGVKPRWQWRVIYKLASKHFQAITFPSDFIRHEAEAIHPPVEKISYTIRNPLPIPDLPTYEGKLKARKTLELPLDTPIVGNAGWLIAGKRFDVFLQVAAEVHKTHP